MEVAFARVRSKRSFSGRPFDFSRKISFPNLVPGLKSPWREFDFQTSTGAVAMLVERSSSLESESSIAGFAGGGGGSAPSICRFASSISWFGGGGARPGAGNTSVRARSSRPSGQSDGAVELFRSDRLLDINSKPKSNLNNQIESRNRFRSRKGQ